MTGCLTCVNEVDPKEVVSDQCLSCREGFTLQDSSCVQDVTCTDGMVFVNDGCKGLVADNAHLQTVQLLFRGACSVNRTLPNASRVEMGSTPVGKGVARVQKAAHCARVAHNVRDVRPTPPSVAEDAPVTAPLH